MHLMMMMMYVNVFISFCYLRSFSFWKEQPRQYCYS